MLLDNSSAMNTSCELHPEVLYWILTTFLEPEKMKIESIARTEYLEDSQSRIANDINESNNRHHVVTEWHSS